MKEIYNINPYLSRDDHYKASERIIGIYEFIDVICFSKRIYHKDRSDEEIDASLYFGKNISITDPRGTIAPQRDVYYPTTIQYPLTNSTRIMVDRTLTKFFPNLVYGM